MPDTSVVRTSLPGSPLMLSGDDAAFSGNRAPPPGIGSVLVGIWRRRFLFLLVFCMVLGAATAGIFALRPVYRSDAVLLIDPRQSNFASTPSVIETPAQTSDLNFVRSEQLILGTDALARRVVQRLDLGQDPDFIPPPDASAGLLARVTAALGIERSAPAVEPVRGSDMALLGYRQRLSAYNDGKSFVIQVGFSHADPEKARAILAAHLELYLDDQRARKELVIAKAGRWLDQELVQLREKVQRSEQQLQAFRGDNRLVRTGGETISGRQLADVTAQLGRARADLSRLGARNSEVASGRPDSAVLNSELVQRLRQQEATLGSVIAELQQRYGAGHPKLAEARSALANVQARTQLEVGRLSSATTSDVSISRSDVRQFEQQVASLERQAVASSQAELSASQLDREIEADRRLYSDLLARSKQVAIQKEIQEPDARVVSPPSLAVTPAFPRRGLLFVIAAAAAAVIAGGIVLLLGRLRPHTQTLSDIEAFHGIAGLGDLPRIRRFRLRDAARSDQHLRPAKLATAVQVISNSITFRMREGGSKVIVIASPGRGDGRTSTAILLARSLAEKGERVLLVDADLKRRGVTACLQMAAHPGLIDGVRRSASLDELVVLGVGSETAGDQAPGKGAAFDVLPTGWDRVDSHTILHRAELRSLLAEARARYSIILVDTPPLAEVDDALAFVADADATVLVVRCRRTSDGALQAAVRRLHLAHARIVGAVLNGTTGSTSENSAHPGVGNYDGPPDWAKAYLAARS